MLIPLFYRRSYSAAFMRGNLFSMSKEIVEEWCHVKWDETYIVSNFGNVLSLWFNSKLTGFVKRKKPLKLKPTKSGGYLSVCLRVGIIRINRLVAIHFVPNPDHKPEVNHLDGNKLNNIYSNLEWSTRSENVLHAYRQLKVYHVCGENSRKSNLKNKDVAVIFKSTLPAKELCDRFGVGRKSIENIRNGRSWTHITKQLK